MTLCSLPTVATELCEGTRVTFDGSKGRIDTVFIYFFMYLASAGLYIAWVNHVRLWLRPSDLTTGSDNFDEYCYTCYISGPRIYCIRRQSVE